MLVKQKQILNTVSLLAQQPVVGVTPYATYMEYGLGAVAAQAVALPLPALHEGKMLVINNMSNFNSLLSPNGVGTGGIGSPFGNDVFGTTAAAPAFRARTVTKLISIGSRWNRVSVSGERGSDLSLIVLAKGSIFLGNPITTGPRSIVGGINVAANATVAAQAADRTTVLVPFTGTPINNGLADYFVNAQMRSNTAVVLNDNNFVISTVAQTANDFRLSMRRLTNVVSDVILDFQITTTR
jgi:hypothetical protein